MRSGIFHGTENTANSFIMTSVITQKLVTGLYIFFTFFFKCQSLFKAQNSLSLLSNKLLPKGQEFQKQEYSCNICSVSERVGI